TLYANTLKEYSQSVNISENSPAQVKESRVSTGDKDSDTGNWTVVPLRRRNQKSDRPTPVRGSNSNSTLTAAVRTSWIFVTGLNTSTSNEDIIQYQK
ncbi:hypothetical protein HHI36_010906, partial [Cryptolaemus montrouzieri]